MNEGFPSSPKGSRRAALRHTFESRDALVAHVASLASWLPESPPSPFEGGRRAAEARLGTVAPERYARTRNHLDGAVTRLSPYIRHGIVSLREVYEVVVARVDAPQRAEKLIQELAWRDYWQRVYDAHPEWIWNDVEPYKTGFSARDYAESLPDDIKTGHTGVACIDHFIHTLLTTGYLHNHARMYVAAYVVHWRRIRWQAGARWFLHHLIDGDPASNNLSWQWVASTFSRKPYIFNLDNVRRYTGDDVDTTSALNQCLDDSYEALSARLFPYGVSS